MLVDFTVSNFRSIGEPITLSMAAGSSASKRSRFSVETGNSFAPHLLRSAVILGPNSAGKSSFVSAIDFFVDFVTTSNAGGPEDSIEWPKNRLGNGPKDGSASFEIVFLSNATLYEYRFVIDETRVLFESLYSRDAKRGSHIRPVFERSVSEDEEPIWSMNEARLPGMRETWRKATRSNSLFLTTAVQLNSESLSEPYNWIATKLRVIESGARITPEFTAKLLEDESSSPRVAEIIQSMDLGISSWRISSEKFESLPENARKVLSPEFLKKIEKNLEGAVRKKIYPNLISATGNQIEFEFEEMSDGTQVILGLAGPIFDVLKNGFTLVVDELSNSLHPMALRAIVDLFNNSDVNRSGAQIIFTSHEPSLINSKYLHRDQIWFIENSDGEGSKLTPLSDFSVRESESFDRGYLGGRYGALPSLKDIRSAFAE